MTIEFKDTVITEELKLVFSHWHDQRFTRCRGGFKHNNQCNHFAWFLVGWAAAKGNFEIKGGTDSWEA